MLLSLAAPSATARATIEQLGIKVFDASGKLKPMTEVAGELQRATANLSKEARTAALSNIFGSFGLAGAAVLAKEGAAGFSEMAGALGKVSAADVAKEKLNNLHGALTILKGSVETAGVMLGSAFQPALQSGVQAITGLVNATMPAIERFATEFPAKFETFKLGVIGAFQGATAWVQANWPLVATVIGLVGLTVTTTMLSMAGSVAMFGLALLTNGLFAVTSFAASIVTVGLPALLSFIGMMVTTVIPNVIMFGSVLLTQGLGSALAFAAGLFTGPVAAVLTFAATLLTQGIGAAVAFGLSLMSSNAAAGASFLINLIPNAIAAATTLLTTTVPAAAAAAAAFLTQTVPALIATGAAFLVNLIAGANAAATTLLTSVIPAAASAAVTFLGTTVPALVATGVAFLVNLIPAAIAAAATFLTVMIPAAIAAAVSFLTVTVPALIATGIGFISMGITAAVALAGMVASAIAAGIATAIAFWPITLAVLAVIAIGYFLWKNWSAIWGGVVKFTAKVGQTIGKIFHGAMSFVTGVVGRAGQVLGPRFEVIKATGLKAIGGLSTGMRKGIAGMASKVTEIVGKLASWVADKLAIMANAALDVIRKIPGAEAIIGAVGNIGNGIKSMLKFAKETFDWGGAGESAGESYGEGFMHGTGSVAGSREMGGSGAGGGLGGLAGGMMDMLGIDMPEMPDMDASAAVLAGGGGGGGGAGAGAKDPMGIWSGTDSKGAWTIDPATGKKIYDAGSVGAVGQQAAASAKAEREAAKQAKDGKGKSKIGAAVSKALKGDESLNLAQAFTSAISDAADLIGDIVGSDLPTRDQWMPKLDLIKQFFVDAGQVFASIAADARNKSDKITGQGALNKGDIENLMVFAEPWGQAMDMLSKTVSTMGDISELKKLPSADIMTGIESFMLQAAASGTRVLGTIDKATAEVWTPVAGALSGWMDAIGKAAKTASDLVSLDLKGDLIPALARVDAFMLEVAKRTGAFVMSARKALGYALEDALITSRDVASTFGAWFDVLGKVGASVESVSKVKLAPGWDTRLTAFMGGVAAVGALYVAGLSNALPPEGRGPALALSRDVAATFGAWGDSLIKIGDAADKISKAKPVTEQQLGAVRDLMGRVAEFGASFLRGPGYDLTKDAKRTAQDLGIVRDVFTTLSAGVDAVAKGAGLDLAKATRVTAAQIETAALNTQDAVGAMVDLASLWRVLPDEARAKLFAEIKDYTAVIGPAVDALAKASNLGLDKATRATSAQIEVAALNAVDAVAAVVDLSMAWEVIDDEARGRLFDGIKAYGEMLGPAVDALAKAANLGLGEATRVTTKQLVIAQNNALEAAAVIEDMVVDLLGPDGKLPQRTADLWAGAKLFGEHVATAADALAKAADLGLEGVTRVTADQLRIAYNNGLEAAAVLEDMVVSYLGADGKVPQRTAEMWAGAKLYGETLATAVDALGKAGSLGGELVGAIRVTTGGLAIAETNAQAAFASLERLAAGFSAMDKAAREAYMGPLADYSKTASEAIELLTKAAGLGAALARVRPVTDEQVALLRGHLLAAVRAVAGAAEDAGPDAMALATQAATKVGPVADALGKVLAAFDTEQLMKNPLIVSKVGSAWMTGVRQRRASALADQIRAGLVLTFQTLGSAAEAIPDVSSDVAAKVASMVAAYDPLIGLIERLGNLKIDLGQVGMLAQVPGILAAGLPGAGPGSGGGGTGSGAGGGGASLFTGAITATGPVMFSGSLEVSLNIDGQELTKIQRNGQWQISRGRAANSAPAG